MRFGKTADHYVSGSKRFIINCNTEIKFLFYDTVVDRLAATARLVNYKIRALQKFTTSEVANCNYAPTLTIMRKRACEAGECISLREITYRPAKHLDVDLLRKHKSKRHQPRF